MQGHQQQHLRCGHLTVYFDLQPQHALCCLQMELKQQYDELCGRAAETERELSNRCAEIELLKADMASAGNLARRQLVNRALLDLHPLALSLPTLSRHSTAAALHWHTCAAASASRLLALSNFLGCAGRQNVVSAPLLQVQAGSTCSPDHSSGLAPPVF